MKIRTIYFKVPDINKACEFWQSFLGIEPHKSSASWIEFKLDNLNFSLLKLDHFQIGKDQANCVPVFEFADSTFEDYVRKAKSIGAHVVFDIKEHPDGKSYVFTDPFGNEFEVTRFHD